MSFINAPNWDNFHFTNSKESWCYQTQQRYLSLETSNPTFQWSTSRHNSDVSRSSLSDDQFSVTSSSPEMRDRNFRDFYYPAENPRRNPDPQNHPGKPSARVWAQRTTTKRKEQNRKAQRAYREKKETHIKDLEKRISVLTEELRVLRSQYVDMKYARSSSSAEDEFAEYISVESAEEARGRPRNEGEATLEYVALLDFNWLENLSIS